VVVKAHVSRHQPGKARGSLSRHVSYLGRESASLDGKHGVFYDAMQDKVKGRQEALSWVQDRHHFRLIVSPEHGADIPDLKDYVRQVMRRVERDLDTKLTWIAVNHHNTDNPHTHVLLRGKQADGSDLVIPRQYISYGIRERASEVATELLGVRSAQGAQVARLKEVQAERFTALDRMIERHLEGGKIDVSPSRQIGFDAGDRQLAVGRLQFLEQLELAHKGRGTSWQVDDNFKQALRDLGNRNDIISQLYSHLGHEAGRVNPMNARGEASPPVAGVVIAKGSVDEIGEDRFIVLRDADGQAHYGRVRDGDAYRDLKIGSLAELGDGAERKRQLTHQIVAVAAANGATYSAELHEVHLRAAEPNITEREVVSTIRSAAVRLAFVAGAEGSGVRTLEEGKYAVNANAFAHFSLRGGSRTDVRVIAMYPLAEQIEAHAVTWLDRQAFGPHPEVRLRDNSMVMEAMQQRCDWLVRHGYARSTGDGQRVELLPTALEALANKERSDLGERLAKKHNKPVTELPQGGTVDGKFVGVETLQSGKLAVVVAEESVYVSPVRKSPEIASGGEVTLRRASSRESTVERSSALDRDAGRSLEGRGGD
jgi:type IV secretory pathway VirD2 relaxase